MTKSDEKLFKYYGYLIDDKKVSMEKKMNKLKSFADIYEIELKEIVVEHIESNYGNKLFEFIDSLVAGDGLILYSIGEISSSTKLFFEIITKAFAKQIKLSTIDNQLNAFTPTGEFCHNIYYAMSNLIEIFIKPVFVTERKVQQFKDLLGNIFTPEEISIFEEHFEYKTKEEYEQNSQIPRIPRHLKYVPHERNREGLDSILPPKTKYKGVVPYGWVGSNRTLNGVEQIKEEQEIISRIKNLYRMEKKSYNQIAKIFNEEKIKSPRKCKSWTANKIEEIEKECYVKEMEEHGKEFQ